MLSTVKKSDSVALIVVNATMTVPVAISPATVVKHFSIFHLKPIAAVALLVLEVAVIVGMDLVGRMVPLLQLAVLFLAFLKENQQMFPML